MWMVLGLMSSLLGLTPQLVLLALFLRTSIYVQQKLHDQLTVLNITSFKTCSKEAIRLGDNMREGDEIVNTSVPSIVGSKDPDASSPRPPGSNPRKSRI